MAWYTPIPQNDPPSKFNREYDMLKVLELRILATRFTIASIFLEVGTEKTHLTTFTYWT
jgi:hypothetical protein